MSELEDAAVHMPKKHAMKNNWTDSCMKKFGEILYAEKNDEDEPAYIFKPKDKMLVTAAAYIDQRCTEILQHIGMCSGPGVLNEYGIMRNYFQNLAQNQRRQVMHYRGDCIKAMVSSMISERMEFQNDVHHIQVKVGRLSYKIVLYENRESKQLWH